MNNYQNGGWYNSPNGRNQQYWNGQWYDSPQQNNPAVANPFQANLDTLNNNTNNYYNQQQGFYQKNHDIQQGQYDTQNTLALGAQDQGAKDAFLNQVYNPLMKQEGSYQYKYGLDTANNDALYGLHSTANQQNRDLALAKLATDEQNNLAQLGLTQGQTNQAKLEELNSRGLLYGQQPTGGYQPNAIGGVSGVAGQQAGLTNQGFAIQRNQIEQPYQENVLGANQAYAQQQGLDTQNHLYTGQTNAYDAANNINNQNMNYSANTALNNNQLEQYKASLNNQKQQQLYNNEQNAKTQGAMQNGYALYK